LLCEESTDGDKRKGRKEALIISDQPREGEGKSARPLNLDLRGDADAEREGVKIVSRQEKKVVLTSGKKKRKTGRPEKDGAHAETAGPEERGKKLTDSRAKKAQGGEVKENSSLWDAASGILDLLTGTRQRKKELGKRRASTATTKRRGREGAGRADEPDARARKKNHSRKKGDQTREEYTMYRSVKEESNSFPRCGDGRKVSKGE